MRRRIARHLPLISRWAIGLVGLGQILLGASFIATRRDYTMAIAYFSAGICSFGWALTIYRADQLQGSLEAWKESATDWKNIAEDRRSNARWHR